LPWPERACQEETVLNACELHDTGKDSA